MIPETGMRTRGAQNLFCRFLHHEQSVREPLPLVGPPLRDGEAGGSTTFRGFCMSAPRNSTSSGARRAAERGEHRDRLVLVEVADRRAEEEHRGADAGRAGERAERGGDVGELAADRVDVSAGKSARRWRAVASSTLASMSIGTYSSTPWRRSSASMSSRVLRASPLPSSTSDSGRPNAATISSLCAPRIDSSVRVTSYSGRFVIALKSAEPSAS